MARATRKTRGSKQAAATRRRRAAGSSNAIELLKADHRQVEEWFGQFEKSRSKERKQDLAGRICRALRVHAQIEEEIFYPAFLEASGDKSLHHEAQIEHEGAKKLIAQIEKSDADDDYFDSKVKVLSEMIKHHVKEEEKRDGMFAEAKRSGMDLEELGAELKARKAELSGESAPRMAGGMEYAIGM